MKSIFSHDRVVQEILRKYSSLAAALTKKLNALAFSYKFKRGALEDFMVAAYLEGYKDAQREVMEIMAKDTRRLWNVK